MARNIKIIEFYGLPGCGKTTLRSHMLSSSKMRCVAIQDIIPLHKQESFFYKITHLPIKKWWFLSLFLLSLPSKRKTSRKSYIDLYAKVILYTYFFNNIPTYDYVLVDHGLVQQLGSILHNVNYELSESSLRKFVKFLNCMKETELVYCRISCELSLNRMIIRNRNVGRIDAMMNDKEKALYYLDKEFRLFERIAQITNDNSWELDMTKSPIELAIEVYNMIGFEKVFK